MSWVENFVHLFSFNYHSYVFIIFNTNTDFFLKKITNGNQTKYTVMKLYKPSEVNNIHLLTGYECNSKFVVTEIPTFARGELAITLITSHFKSVLLY